MECCTESGVTSSAASSSTSMAPKLFGLGSRRFEHMASDFLGLRPNLEAIPLFARRFVERVASKEVPAPAFADFLWDNPLEVEVLTELSVMVACLLVPPEAKWGTNSLPLEYAFGAIMLQKTLAAVKRAASKVKLPPWTPGFFRLLPSRIVDGIIGAAQKLETFSLEVLGFFRSMLDGGVVALVYSLFDRTGAYFGKALGHRWSKKVDAKKEAREDEVSDSRTTPHYLEAIPTLT